MLDSETKDVGDIDVELDRLTKRDVDRAEISAVAEDCDSTDLFDVRGVIDTTEMTSRQKSRDRSYSTDRSELIRKDRS